MGEIACWRRSRSRFPGGAPSRKEVEIAGTVVVTVVNVPNPTVSVVVVRTVAMSVVVDVD